MGSEDITTSLYIREIESYELKPNTELILTHFVPLGILQGSMSAIFCFLQPQRQYPSLLPVFSSMDIP